MPISPWNVPPKQGVHSSCLGASAYDPMAHAVCCVEPAVAKWPGVASVHSLAAVRFVAFEYDPAGQGRGTLVPFGQK
jgi:hypothetical protein